MIIDGIGCCNTSFSMNEACSFPKLRQFVDDYVITYNTFWCFSYKDLFSLSLLHSTCKLSDAV